MPFLNKSKEERQAIVQRYKDLKASLKDQNLRHDLGLQSFNLQQEKTFAPILTSQANILQGINALPERLSSLQQPSLPTLTTSSTKEDSSDELQAQLDRLESATGLLIRELDAFAPTMSSGNVLVLGSKVMTIDSWSKQLDVEGVKYAFTDGLQELLFEKTPDASKIHESDKRAYKEILTITNPFVRADGSIKRSTTVNVKWREYQKQSFDTLKERGIIPKMKRTPSVKSPAISKLRRTPDTPLKGDGLMPSNPKSIKKLLMLKLSAYNAGNTGLANDIIDYIDELKRQGLIDKNMYKHIAKHVSQERIAEKIRRRR